MTHYIVYYINNSILNSFFLGHIGRLNSNQPQLGFLNPLLYYTKTKYPQSFRDITVGDNACGVGLNLNELLCCEYSFSAAPGWDAGKENIIFQTQICSFRELNSFLS